MIVKDLKKTVNRIISDKNWELQDLARELKVNDKTLFNYLKSESIPKTKSFINLSRVLNLDINKFLDTGTMEQRITNNVNVQHGTINNVQNLNAKELEVLRVENASLKTRIKDLEKIITLLEK